VTVGLLVTSLLLGLRHGIDWDHIAAIADLTGAAENRRKGFLLSLYYALGHAAVVFVLGSIAILFGAAIPESFDSWMGRIVGVTLIALGIWVLVGLVRHGRDFRLRSRWMLVLNGTFAGLRKVTGRAGERHISVEHDHDHHHDEDAAAHTEAHAHDHSHTEQGADTDMAATSERRRLSTWLSRRQHTHHHAHQHDLALPDSADSSYGSGTAAGIGMLHGVGFESPTQIAVFVASTSVEGGNVGLMVLLAWVVGLVLANSGLAVLAGLGLLNAERNFTIYATLAVVVAVASIVVGIMFVGEWDLLPEI